MVEIAKDASMDKMEIMNATLEKEAKRKAHAMHVRVVNPKYVYIPTYNVCTYYLSLPNTILGLFHTFTAKRTIITSIGASGQRY